MSRQFLLQVRGVSHSFKRNYANRATTQFLDTLLSRTGYVNTYQKEKNCGFIVSDEDQKEFFFRSSELQTGKGAQLIRPYTPVTFQLGGRLGNQCTKIKGKDGGKLGYIISAMKSENKMNKNLSEHDEKLSKRHAGVVTYLDNENRFGWIQPKLVGFNTVRFSFEDLHCTGIQRIREH